MPKKVLGKTKIAEKRERANILLKNFLTSESCINAGKEIRLSEAQSWRIIANEVGSITDAKKSIKKGYNLLIYFAFQVIRDKKRICEIFDISEDAISNLLVDAHNLLLPENRGSCKELIKYECENCGKIFIKKESRRKRRFCDTCKPIMAAKDTTKRVKKWLKNPDNRKKMNEYRKEYRSRLKKQETL